jgi:hypothetical protein
MPWSNFLSYPFKVTYRLRPSKEPTLRPRPRRIPPKSCLFVCILPSFENPNTYSYTYVSSLSDKHLISLSVHILTIFFSTVFRTTFTLFDSNKKNLSILILIFQKKRIKKKNKTKQNKNKKKGKIEKKEKGKKGRKKKGRRKRRKKKKRKEKEKRKGKRKEGRKREERKTFVDICDISVAFFLRCSSSGVNVDS